MSKRYRTQRRSDSKAKTTADDPDSTDTIQTRFVLSADPAHPVPWHASFSEDVDTFIRHNSTLLSILITNAYWNLHQNVLAIEFRQTSASFPAASTMRTEFKAIHQASARDAVADATGGADTPNQLVATLAERLGCTPALLEKLDQTRSRFQHAFLLVCYLVVEGNASSSDGGGGMPQDAIHTLAFTQDMLACHPIVAHHIDPVVVKNPHPFVVQVNSPTTTAGDETEPEQTYARSQRIDLLLQKMTVFRAAPRACAPNPPQSI